MSENVSFEISSDVPVRLASAADIFRSLESDISTFVSHSSTWAPAWVASTGTEVVLTVAEPDLPKFPTDWAVRFGHAVHDLRAALDHLMQQVCMLEGAVPVDIRKVQFPIAGSGKEWRNARKWLSSMPATLLDRVEQLQPLKSDNDVTRGLSLLNDIAVRDKHYELIPMNPGPGAVELETLRSRASSASEKAKNAPWLRLTFDTDASSGEFPSECEVVASSSPLFVMSRRCAPFPMVMRYVHSATAAAVHFIASGVMEIEMVPEPDWAYFFQG